MIPNIADIVLVGVTAALFWLSIFYIYRRFTVDVFRQKMFEVRDDFFDFAADGNIKFDHPAYKLLRTTMNGFLRYGHKISLFEVFVIAICTKKDLQKKNSISFDKRWIAATSGITPELKKQLDLFRVKMHRVLMIQLLMGSPFFACILIPTIIAVEATNKISFSILSKITKPLEICLAFQRLILDDGPRFMNGPISQAQSTALLYGKNDVIAPELLAA